MLIMTPLRVICQTTDINLSSKQSLEVYKGLLQGENLKETVNALRSNNSELFKAVNLGKSIENDLKLEIEKLKKIIEDKNKFIENQQRQNEIEQSKLKEQSKKRWGVGLVGGYGYVTNSNVNQGFIGIGISYDIFRF